VFSVTFPDLPPRPFVFNNIPASFVLNNKWRGRLARWPAGILPARPNARPAFPPAGFNAAKLRIENRPNDAQN